MKPILFNTEMVRAIQEGCKTVTRRVIKYSCPTKPERTLDDFIGTGDPQLLVDCATYQPGDILWVRETWRPVSSTIDFWETGEPTAVNDGVGYQYKADGKIIWSEDFKPQDDEFHTTEVRYDEKWRPSIHMPKEAARLFLRVTGVRVERLRPMGIEDFEAEGLSTICGLWATTDTFADLWDNTIKPAELPRYGWEANPWVWVVEFERISKEAAMGGGGDG